MNEQQYREARRRHPELALPSFCDLKAEVGWIITRKRFTRRHLIAARAAALLAEQKPTDSWLSFLPRRPDGTWTEISPRGFDGIAPNHPKRGGYLMGLDPAFGDISKTWVWTNYANA